MPTDLSLIKTIVIVMMENRSFDHLVGYLSLPPINRQDVDGLQSNPNWLTKASSLYDGSSFAPFPLTDPYDLMAADPPHERDNIAVQMGTEANGTFPLNGFVTNYTAAKGAAPVKPGDQIPVMGYFTADQVPVTDFFAENYAVCDRWFSALPAGTQPNRLMAMSGFSKIAVNQFPLPDQELVYDWLTANNVRWRVYHEGMPFFAMMPRWIPEVLLEAHFRPLARLYDDVQNEPSDEFPQVIFVEPMYTDAPHIGPSSDDHAPSAVKGGQQFLLEAYRAMSLNPDVWKGTVMVVTYDEHGGFFDHVSPPALKTAPPPGANYTEGFENLGVRVPGLVLSPFVSPRSVFHGTLDHTSILKFIAQKFGNGKPYSDLVDQRQVGSVLDVLNLQAPRTDIPSAPPLIAYLAKDPAAAGYVPGTPPPDAPISQGFRQGLEQIRTHPDTGGNFAELLAAFPATSPTPTAVVEPAPPPPAELKSYPERNLVFISYSHQDSKWLRDLMKHLKPYLRNGMIRPWSDEQIRAGSRWLQEIQSALAFTKVALLLVTADFLASDFIDEHELVPLLKGAERGGVRILWIPVKASAYKETSLKDYQSLIPPNKPLAEMKAERDRAWVRICEEVNKAVNL